VSDMRIMNGSQNYTDIGMSGLGVIEDREIFSPVSIHSGTNVVVEPSFAMMGERENRIRRQAAANETPVQIGETKTTLGAVKAAISTREIQLTFALGWMETVIARLRADAGNNLEESFIVQGFERDVKPMVGKWIDELKMFPAMQAEVARFERNLLAGQAPTLSGFFIPIIWLLVAGGVATTAIIVSNNIANNASSDAEIRKKELEIESIWLRQGGNIIKLRRAGAGAGQGSFFDDVLDTLKGGFVTLALVGVGSFLVWKFGNAAISTVTKKFRLKTAIKGN